MFAGGVPAGDAVVSVYVREPEQPIASVAVTVNENVPIAAGVPLNVPPENWRFGGRAPVRLNVLGGAPPLAPKGTYIAAPTVPLLIEEGVTVGPVMR
jgi:hypothetical protein